MSAEKILILGGTGVMGSYLVPELLKMNYRLDVCTNSVAHTPHQNVRYIYIDCMNIRTLRELLKEKYDVIIDFMTYQTYQFAERYQLLLENTQQLIFLSSYRVYSDLDIPIREDSPRLLDVTKDDIYLQTDDYSLSKARQENILFGSKYTNWTIARPTIVYSNQRLQLTTLEAPQILRRAKEGKQVLIAKEAAQAQATMTWSGDVAKMLSRLVMNEAALREAFSIATAEHHSWAEVADYYRELIGLKWDIVDMQTYLGFFDNALTAQFQMKYDRCQKRIMDNSKILKVTGLEQANFLPLKQGLELELEKIQDYQWPMTRVYEAMDRYLGLIE